MSNLPDLPIKHNKREADFGVEFRNKFDGIKHLLPEDCQFELKQTEGNKFYLRDLKPKQRTPNKGLIRLSVATEGSPDYQLITSLPLYIVIKFKRNAYIIPIENIDFSLKSLTEMDCKKISTILL
jgi:hypothetical protein